MATILKRFTKGIVLRAESSDNTENAEGSLFQNSSDARIKTYIEGAVRQVVTNSQAQVLTQKTIVVANNTITTAASGNLAATELNAALAELQSDIDTRALGSTVSSHIGASSGVHGVTGSVVGTSDSQALTNKTIVASSNTITTAASGNLAAVELNAALAELQGDIDTRATSTALTNHINNVSGAHAASAISNTPSGNLAATTVQAALNELQSDIDTRALSVGGSIQSPTRLDVKKDTKANLVTYAATASNGQLCFATDSKEMFQVVDGALVSVGSSGASNVDALLTQTFDQNTLSDFTQTGLALVSTNPMNGAQSARLIHQAATTQSFKYVKAVDPKYRGKNLTMSFQVRSSATAGNVTLNVYDETNAANIISSQSITLGSSTITATTNSNTTLSGISSSDINKIKVGETITGSGIPTGTTITAISISALTATISQAATASATVTLKNSDLPQKQSASFDVPNNCASLSYTISALAESGLPETYVDDVVIQLTSSALTSTSVTVPVNNDTEWASYTPTFTGFGTVTTSAFFWRREGSDVLLRGRFISGTSTATEARVSLPVSLTSSLSISTLEVVGDLVVSITDPASFYSVIEPNVSYVTFSRQLSPSFAGLTKRNGSELASSGTSLSFFARIPIQGWSANQTTSTTIPLTSAVFTTQPDSQMTWQGFAGLGSSRTRIPYFTNPRNMVGSAISWTSNSTNGLEITVQEDGYYTVTGSFNTTTSGGSANNRFGLGLNLTDFTTTLVSRETDTTVLSTNLQTPSSGGVYSGLLTWSGPLKTGDKLYPMCESSTFVAAPCYFSIAKVGSTKQVNISSDQKIDLPTSELKTDYTLGVGSSAGNTLYFNGILKLRGDAFEVTNSSVTGFSLRMKKKGSLQIDGFVSLNATGETITISRNATQLSIDPRTMTVGQNLAASFGNTCEPSWSGSVDVNDIFRIHTTATQTLYPNRANIGDGFNFYFREEQVQVSLSNVLPQFTQSDSSIRLDTVNGYGSTNLNIRRFSNVRDNVGTDITYTDSASAGASFLINTDGIYNISYVDNFTSSSSAYVGISKNSSQLSTQIFSINDADRLASSYASGATGTSEVSWSGFLQKGDVIRPHVGNVYAATSNGLSSFTISKVGKPNLTSVDVTPFTNYKGTDTEFISLYASPGNGSTASRIRRFSNTLKNTNLGIIRYTDDAINGGSFTALKKCRVNVSYSDFTSSNGALFGISKNASSLTTNYASLSADQLTNIANSNIGTLSDQGHVSTTVQLEAGDILRAHHDGNFTATGDARVRISITAVAEADQIVSPISSFSSDTASFVFQSTALTGNEAVGTFNTYTYAANTNTATIATSAPTQTVSDMNVNGIRVFARAGNVTSTAASPARVDIVIGKGFKGKQIDGYANTGKTTQFNYDMYMYNGVQDQRGTRVTYNENTGILSINAAVCDGVGSTTASSVGLDVNSASAALVASGYFVINASKSPSLAAVPQLQPRVAVLSDVQTSGTNGGTFTAGAFQTRTLNTLVDGSGIVTSLASNQFVLSAGEYFIEASAPALYVGNHQCKLRNITDSTDALTGSSEVSQNISGSWVTRSVISGRLVLTSSKTFELQHRCGATNASTGFGAASTYGINETYSIVKIQKIK